MKGTYKVFWVISVDGDVSVDSSSTVFQGGIETSPSTEITQKTFQIHLLFFQRHLFEVVTILKKIDNKQAKLI